MTIAENHYDSISSCREQLAMNLCVMKLSFLNGKVQMKYKKW